MTLEDIKRADPSGMYVWVRDFHRQVEDGVKIGKAAKVKLNVHGVRNIVLTGLGGSAIGGDLLRSYLADELAVPFIINRHYYAPDFVDKNTLVVVSSYSGNTEETIAAHQDAVKRKAKVLCISTGGETEKMAKKYKQPWIQIPPGYSPRAALGYSFFPLLVVLSKLGFVKSKDKDMKETISLLQRKGMVLSDPDSPENAALHLAQQLKGKLPIIYSANEHLDAVNIRWRGQIAENAKQLGFGHVLPEMNHNELVGWKVLADLMRQMHVIFLKDKGTHKRVAMRENITKDIVSQYTSSVTEVWSEGISLLARMFSLIHVGDWVSFYLAILNNQDPTPVKVIDFLKGELAKV
ncbi:MAG: bifunctional phosphoglucose/phosphomannose isomerase [Ignavibacteriales bacterium]|nr:bifunctional phosphoglucose/phosphomannose isomerase [Ignavibacteriales bacterium]